MPDSANSSLEPISHLIVMRHAKSDWSDASESDHERSLNDRGRRDAPRVAQALVDAGWLPEQILSSDSQRTRETYEQMVSAFPHEVPGQFHATLYHAGLSEILAEAPSISEDVSILMVLGHNPGWQEAVHRLSGDYVTMKTANAALLEGEGADWADALRQRSSWRLVDVIRAREL